jgi:hypothetical protein
MIERKKRLQVAAWVLVVVAGLLVVGRIASAVPVAAEVGVLVEYTDTPTSTSNPPTSTPVSTSTPVATATPEPSQGEVANPSFETGDLTGWQTEITGGKLPEPFVWDGTIAANAPSPAWPIPHWTYATWVDWTGCGPGTIRLMQDMTLPLGRPVMLFDYRASWDLEGTIAGGPAPDGSGLAQKLQDQHFSVLVEEAGGGAELARYLILTAPGGTPSIPGVESTQAYGPVEPDTGLLLGTVDLSRFAGQDVRIVFEWTVPNCVMTQALAQLDNIRLVQGSTGRADVSAIIYGGWNDIAAHAWVGGTRQETLYTAMNSYGDAQAMWTFYPDGAWPVTVDVDLPAGLDPDQWELVLLRIESPTGDWVLEDPDDATFSIVGNQQYNVVYQLVSK